LLPDPPLFPSIPLVGWAVVAAAGVLAVWIVLKIVGKAISITIRLAILVGVVLVAAAALCWLSAALRGGRLPFT
jgi:hypothetical protein